MFPIANEQGKVIAFTGRTLSTDEKAGPKYLNSPETPIYSKSRVLFNLDKAKEAINKLDYAILVEGQMDCISVYNAGFHNVIASSGTAFTEIQAKLLGRFSKNVVVNFDPDTAGAAAAERTLALLIAEDFQVQVLTLESGFGSHRLGIDSAVLRQELRHAAGSRSTSRVSASTSGRMTDAERVLIRALASQNGSGTTASNREGQDGEFDPARQAHFALTRERLHEASSAEALIELMLSAHEQGADPMSLQFQEGDRSTLAAVLMDEREEITPELLESAIRSLRRRLLLRQLDDLQHQLKEAERRQDQASAARLLQERVKLRRAMSAIGETA